MNGGRFKKSGVENLNLIPLMNLFVTMIPLLLLTAAFTHIGMVSVSVPSQSEEESSVAAGKTAVTVNIHLSRRGYTITASSATLSEAELKALDAFVPRRGRHFDYEKLTRSLERVKRRYEQSDTVLIVPDKDIPYQEMVETMDAARNMVLRVGGKKRKIPLFPVVVVSSLAE
jgi:biopolymer transport protein ExbD